MRKTSMGSMEEGHLGYLELAGQRKFLEEKIPKSVFKGEEGLPKRWVKK